MYQKFIRKDQLVSGRAEITVNVTGTLQENVTLSVTRPPVLPPGFTLTLGHTTLPKESFTDGLVKSFKTYADVSTGYSPVSEWPAQKSYRFILTATTRSGDATITATAPLDIIIRPVVPTFEEF
jgi:hypothetical protein